MQEGQAYSVILTCVRNLAFLIIKKKCFTLSFEACYTVGTL